MAAPRRRQHQGPRGRLMLCGAIVCAVVTGTAAAAPRTALPAAEPLPGELLGRWFDLVSSEGVITSEPQIHMYCADGVRFSYGSKGTRTGRYTYRSGELCEEGTGWRYCNRLRKTPEGFGLSAAGGEAVVTRFVHVESGPPEPRCLQSIAREELTAPLALPPTRAKRSR